MCRVPIVSCGPLFQGARVSFQVSDTTPIQDPRESVKSLFYICHAFRSLPLRLSPCISLQISYNLPSHHVPTCRHSTTLYYLIASCRRYLTKCRPTSMTKSYTRLLVARYIRQRAFDDAIGASIRRESGVTEVVKNWFSRIGERTRPRGIGRTRCS